MRRRSTLVVVALLCLVVAVAPEQAIARGQGPGLETIEITESLHSSLVLLQEQWLEWLAAYHSRDAARAGEVLREIQVTMRDLRVDRLSDLSLGATLSAVMAARASDFERAYWALEAAETLDAERPEIAFATATVARLEGRPLAAVSAQIAGYYRLFRSPWERSIVLQDALLWALLVLVLGSVGFLLVVFATRAAQIHGDLVGLLSRRLSGNTARIVAAVLLVVPLALPNGLFWLFASWSVLLFAYSSRSEKIVLVGIWILIGVAPVLVNEQRRYMALQISPSVQVMETLRQSRLEGSTMTDLGSLRVSLPESPAVKQLLADVHQQLGQWEFARALYLDVVDAEPENAEAILNLGAFYFRVGDYASAIQLFQRAAVDEGVAAAAQFNLSQSYSASYLFEESEAALRMARRIDEDAVTGWVTRAEDERVVIVEGGLARIPEIRLALEGLRDSFEMPVPLGRRVAESGNLWLAALLLLAALGLYAARRRLGLGATSSHEEEVDPKARAMAETVVPGFAAAVEGRGGLVFAQALLPAALLALPLATALGYRVPWGYEPGNALILGVCLLGLGLYAAVRVRRVVKA